MEKSIVNVAQAILKAMGQIGYLQKDKTVGEGKSAYKGISDNKATQAIREALISAELIAIPISCKGNTKVDRWQDSTGYSKQSMFCECHVIYQIIHAPTGESLCVEAIGHGVDSQDKSAGKAMTYAKKNALLNALLISTGLDADDTHSDNIETPPSAEEIAKANAIAVLKQTKINAEDWLNKALPNSSRDYKSEAWKAETLEKVSEIIADAKAEVKANATAKSQAYYDANLGALPPHQQVTIAQHAQDHGIVEGAKMLHELIQAQTTA